MSKNQHISMPSIRRLPRYYRFLIELRKSGVTRISSMELANRMGLTASQIRQDFNRFGDFGQQGYGYNVDNLITQIGEILGVKACNQCILIGAGNLGKALMNQLDFKTMGFELLAAFDVSPQVIGQTINGYPVLDVANVGEFCVEHHPKMAILCVPRSEAEAIASKLYFLDIHCFWNFSHTDISLTHSNIVVENVHLNDSLMILSYKLHQQQQEEKEAN